MRRIKQRTRSARAIQFRQALQSYAGSRANLSPGVRAAPDIYAALAERALYWTGDLWSGLQREAVRRETLRPTATQVMELVAEYFDHPEHWPTVDPSLAEPARLCIPACFALHVAEAFNSAMRPPLARWGSDNAHAFYQELLGSTVTEAVAAAARTAMAPLLTTARTTGQAPRDTPPVDLTEPPIFDAELRKQWRQTRAQVAPPARMGIPAAGGSRTSATSPTADPEAALRSAWQSRLENAQLCAGAEALRDRDYVGGGYFTWHERTIVLDQSGDFFWRETSHMRVTAAGHTNVTTTHDDRRGTWKLSFLKKGPLLEMHGSDGGINCFWIADGGRGRLLLDGKALSLTK
jgi:hypothetical protein